MTGSFPARLHVLLASQAPVGVVFRRGPANAVCTVGWDRRTNRFELGQWLRGRIYERRADLSPDGRHLIYFARGGRRHKETNGSWTAIARAPFLHAITLYGKGDCWEGGGLFTSNTTYWLNGCHFPVRQSRELTRDTVYRPQGRFGAECPSVYYRRLIRDGWTLETDIRSATVARCTIFSKPLSHGWTLRKYANADSSHPQGSGCYWDVHELEHATSGTILARAEWEWAERDGDSVLWTHAGVLYRALLDPAGPLAPHAIYDFNGMQFEPRRAPY